MNRRTHAIAASLAAPVLLLALAGCGSDGSTPSGGSAETSAATSSEGSSPSSSTEGALGVAKSDLGDIVVDGKKLTAYYFTKDTPNSGKSACAGPCLQAWPPITTTASTPQASGVTGKLGTITLSDGRKQVTLEGRPLYLFAKDSKPGDVNGQGVNKVWYVVAPDGSMITDEPAAGTGY